MKTSFIVGAAIASAAIGFSSAWYIQGLRWKNEVSSLKLVQADGNLKGANETIKLFEGFGQNIKNALQDAQYTRGLNEKAQQDLSELLRSLRTDVSRVRGDVADVSRRVQNASAATNAEYAATCAAVFADVVERGEAMAERGSEISAKAEGHAVDAKQAVDSWPRASSD